MSVVTMSANTVAKIFIGSTSFVDICRPIFRMAVAKAVKVLDTNGFW